MYVRVCVLHVYVFVVVCELVHMQEYVDVRLYLCVWACGHMYIHIYIYVNMDVCPRILCTYIACVRVCVGVGVHGHLRVGDMCMHMYMHP